MYVTTEVEAIYLARAQIDNHDYTPVWHEEERAKVRGYDGGRGPSFWERISRFVERSFTTERMEQL